MRTPESIVYDFIKDIICITLSDTIVSLPEGSFYLYCRLKQYTTRMGLFICIVGWDDTLPKGSFYLYCHWDNTLPGGSLNFIVSQMILLSIRHSEDNCVARWKHYFYLVPRRTSKENIHASREDIHASQEITHRGRI